MDDLPSLQDEEPEIRVPIDMVGFRNIKMPMKRIILGGSEIVVVPVFHVFVDLPDDRRGVHTSRIYGTVLRVVSEYSEKKTRLETVGEEIAKRLLVSHPYSRRAYVLMEAPAYYMAESPVTRSTSYETFKIHLRIKASREIDPIEFVGVELEGLTACPCAREVVKKSFSGFNATHMQRSRAKVLVQIPRNMTIDLLELLEMVRSCFSSPLYSYLKRIDEARVVVNAVESARFVEDTIREIVKKVVTRWSDLPDEMRIVVYVESMESIHPQDIAASIRTSVGEVRRRMGEGAEH